MNLQLIRLRGDSGLSQRALAEKAGVSWETVSRAEAGDPVQITKASAIATALNREMEALFRFEGGWALPIVLEPQVEGA